MVDFRDQGGFNYLRFLVHTMHPVLIFSIPAREQLLDHDQEIIGLKMMKLNRPSGAFRGADTAAHAFGGFDLSLAILVAERR